MFDLERWEEVFESLYSSGLRTLLTGISMLFGVLIIVLLLGFSRGVQNGVTSEFKSDAINRISLRAGTTQLAHQGYSPGRRVSLKDEDFASSAELLPESIEYKTSVVQTWRVPFVQGEYSGNFRLEGAHPEQQFIENQSIVKGRFIQNRDDANQEKYIVIGESMSESLFGKEEAKLGSIIRVLGIPFTLIGIYSDPGGRREESRAFIPLSLNKQLFSPDGTLSYIAFTLLPQQDMTPLEHSQMFAQSLESHLKQKLLVHPDDTRGIRTTNTQENAQQIFSLIATIRIVFWIIGLGTIIASIMGVSNIMLVSVRERITEIGIRKAIGAIPSRIVSTIVFEGILLTATFGFAGVVLGYFLLDLAGDEIQNDFIINPQVDIITIGVILVILVGAGALAGYLPAKRAAQIKTVEALRAKA